MDSIIGYLRAIDEDLGFSPLMLKAPHESIALLSEDAAAAASRCCAAPRA
jgi:hypothetical protein